MTTKYNGYELNYSLKELKKMTSDEMTDIVLLSPDSPEYQALPAGDQKAKKPCNTSLLRQKS